ncbi:MAG: hypothetical protein AAF919_18040 [Pseudomonadota bacterium]
MTTELTLTEDPPDPAAQDEFLLAAGQPPRDAAPRGCRGVAALWARDRDLLVGQGVVLEVRRHALDRDRLVPANWDHRATIGVIELLCVRPEYRWLGLEERLMRHLARLFRVRVPCRDALIYVGEARVPMLLSTLTALPHEVDGRLR